LSGGHQENVHPYRLDYKPGFFLSWLLYRLFSQVKFDENMTHRLRNMGREGCVVYVNKYRGHLDYLLYHFRFRKSRLPFPKLALYLNMSLYLPLGQLFGILKFQLAHLLRNGRFPRFSSEQMIRDAVKNGTTSLLCLVDPEGFKRKFVYEEPDPFQVLIETQKGMERPIFIVPQLVVYQLTPQKERSPLFDLLFGYRDNPGAFRKVILFFMHHRRAFIDFGEPLNLKSYLENQREGRTADEMASEIRHLLIERIDRQKRIILGPVMKSRQQLKERVLTDRKLSVAIERLSSRDKQSATKWKKQAEDYFDEIAADYNPAYVRFFHMALTWVLGRLYHGIDVNPSELAMVRDAARQGGLIYVPTHKSHMDYLVLNYILYLNHMHVPRIAAGQNLAFWPMGHIFRKAGAFFVRRDFKGARLYPRVFTTYVKALVEEGHPIEFFIEGGRSRNGKPILPKTGLLSILLQAQREGYAEDLVLVPVSICYDRVLDEKAYLKELAGESKEKENLKQVLRARRFLRRKYGKIYIRFSKPVSLKQYLAETGGGGQETSAALSYNLVRAMNEVTVVTPLSLVGSAVLSRHRRGFLPSELFSSAALLLQFLRDQGCQVASSLGDLRKALDETLSLLMTWKGIDRLEGTNDEETFYFMEDARKRELDYYKNNIIHFFVDHAFVAASLLTGTRESKTPEEISADYTFLKNLFRHEFVYSTNSDTRPGGLDPAIDYFLKQAYIVPNEEGPPGYKLTKAGFDTLPLWAGMIKTFLESYWVVTRSLMEAQAGTRKKGDLMKNVWINGVKFLRLGLIDHVEAISQASFANAVATMQEEILKPQGEPDHRQMLSALSQLSHRLYELANFKG
jgi:glycerol-3-phosphate O-acyltransferase